MKNWVAKGIASDVNDIVWCHGVTKKKYFLTSLPMKDESGDECIFPTDILYYITAKTTWKKEEEEKWSMIKSAIHRSLFFSPVMDQKSIFFFTPALFPIHNRLHLTMNEPHDSVFYWLYRFGWFFNMYLTKSISLGGTFSPKKIMRNSKCRQYCFGRELGSCHFTNCVLD